MSNQIKLFVVCVVILLQSCVSHPINTISPQLIKISDGVYFKLLPAFLYAESVSMSQLLDISYQDKQTSLIVQIEIDKNTNSLKLVGLTRLGIKVFNLLWQDNKLTSWQQDQVPDVFTPAILLANIQLALWPQKAVAKNLSGNKVALIEAKTNQVKRLIQVNHHTIINIQYKLNKKGLKVITYDHKISKYFIRINTIAMESL